GIGRRRGKGRGCRSRLLPVAALVAAVGEAGGDRDDAEEEAEDAGVEGEVAHQAALRAARAAARSSRRRRATASRWWAGTPIQTWTRLRRQRADCPYPWWRMIPASWSRAGSPPHWLLGEGGSGRLWVRLISSTVNGRPVSAAATNAGHTSSTHASKSSTRRRDFAGAGAAISVPSNAGCT